jgi:hypothetical protein
MRGSVGREVKMEIPVYKIARIANDVSVLASGNPKRIGKRIVNKAIGRSVGKLLYLR